MELLVSISLVIRKYFKGRATLKKAFLSIFSGLAALMSADIARNHDHWSVAVLTVTVHSSFFPTFDFFTNMLLSALDSIC